MQMVQAFLQGSPLEAACSGGMTSEERQAAPDGKHMALKTNRGWHQLLKVTLYYLINGYTSKLYFYRYAPMQLNVALLSR